MEIDEATLNLLNYNQGCTKHVRKTSAIPQDHIHIRKTSAILDIDIETSDIRD